MAPKPRPPLERLMAKVTVDEQTGCWNFTGYRNPDGYGMLGFGPRPTRPWLTHRIAYTFTVGEIPAGMQIDHLCRNRACCNPGHLEAVTPMVNTMRSDSLSKHNAAKTHCTHGHPLSGDNLYVTKAGKRHCRECGRVACRARYQRSKIRAASADTTARPM